MNKEQIMSKQEIYIRCILKPNDTKKDYLTSLINLLKVNNLDFVPEIIEWDNCTKSKKISGFDDLDFIVNKSQKDNYIVLSDSNENSLAIFNSSEQFRWVLFINKDASINNQLTNFMAQVIELKSPHKLICGLAIEYNVYVDYFMYESLPLNWYLYASNAYLKRIVEFDEIPKERILSNPYASVIETENAIIQKIGQSPFDILTEAGKQRYIDYGNYLLDR